MSPKLGERGGLGMRQREGKEAARAIIGRKHVASNVMQMKLSPPPLSAGASEHSSSGPEGNKY